MRSFFLNFARGLVTSSLLRSLTSQPFLRCHATLNRSLRMRRNRLLCRIALYEWFFFSLLLAITRLRGTLG